MIFVNRKPPDFTCKIDDTARIKIINPKDPCTIKDMNTGNELRCASLNSGTSIVSNSTDRLNSILVEYELLCVNSFVQEAGFSVFSAGALLVVPIASHLSDRYGRRRAASDTYLTIGSILCYETVAGSFREWTSLFGVTFWLLGYLYIGVLELFIKNWRKLYFASAIPGLLTIATSRIATLDDLTQANMRFNNVEIDLNKCQSESGHMKLREKFKERTMCDLFKYKRILYFLFVNGYITMTMNFYYFAVSFDSINLTENVFMGYILSGLSEIPEVLL
ncbi:Major facilitator superfamily transporter [Dirofilaria immitis]|nr:Major facilitator superfamily transporter [Dirofilaria immitis]